MAIRYTSSIYSEKGRSITIAIKDKNFSGVPSTFSTIGLNIQYESDSVQDRKSVV